MQMGDAGGGVGNVCDVPQYMRRLCLQVGGGGRAAHPPAPPIAFSNRAALEELQNMSHEFCATLPLGTPT